MGVAVVSRRRRRGVTNAAVRADATRLLHELGESRELSVALVGDDEMQRLNVSFRRIDRPTDVLAFPMQVGTDADLHTPLLGDVAISVDTAAREATRRGIPLHDEVRLLLVHGILHLLGYDHERSPAEARRMFRKQRLLLARLATPDRRGTGKTGSRDGKAPTVCY